MFHFVESLRTMHIFLFYYIEIHFCVDGKSRVSRSLYLYIYLPSIVFAFLLYCAFYAFIFCNASTYERRRKYLFDDSWPVEVKLSLLNALSDVISLVKVIFVFVQNNCSLAWLVRVLDHSWERYLIFNCLESFA